MKDVIRKNKKRGKIAVTALLVFTVLAGFTGFGSYAELTLEAGSKDDQVNTYLSFGDEDTVNYYATQGGISAGKLEEVLNKGYCLQYLDSWKSAGLIPSDFTPTSQKSSSSASSSSSSDTPAATTDNSSDSKKTDTGSTKTYTDAEIEAAWKAVTTVDPTCATDGYTEYKNSLTGKTKQEAIPATGQHTYEVTDSTDATCTEAGSVTYTCSVCGDTYKETIPATGHDDGEWTVTKSAGAYSAGTKDLRCTVCGEVLDTETIPQTCPIPLFGVVAIVVIAGGAIAGVVVVVAKKKKGK